MSSWPMIDRSKIDFDDPEVHNVGYAEGTLSDGRPYRLECWAEDQITCITVFVSTIGLEDFTPGEVMDYLENQGLYRRLSDEYRGDARKFVDPRGNEFWSANLAIGMEDELFAYSLVALRAFPHQRKKTAPHA